MTLHDIYSHNSSTSWYVDWKLDMAVHTNCPLDYCKLQISNIIPVKLDGQCAFNHSGILCGGSETFPCVDLGRHPIVVSICQVVLSAFCQ